MYKKILMAFNGSREGRSALLESAEIAEFMKAETHLLAVFTSVWFVNPQIRKKAKVTMQELTPLARLILEPAVMTVRSDSPYKTAKEYVDAVKAAGPSKMKMGPGRDPEKFRRQRLL